MKLKDAMTAVVIAGSAVAPAAAEQFSAAGESYHFDLDGTNYNTYPIEFDYFPGYDRLRQGMVFELPLATDPAFRGAAVDLLTDFLDDRPLNSLDDRESYMFTRMMAKIAADGGFDETVFLADVGIGAQEWEKLEYKSYRFEMLRDRNLLVEYATTQDILAGSKIVETDMGWAERANNSQLAARARYPLEPLFQASVLEEKDLVEGRRNFARTVANMLNDLFMGEDLGWSNNAKRLPYALSTTLRYAAYFIYPSDFPNAGSRLSDEAKAYNAKIPGYFDEALESMGFSGEKKQAFHKRYIALLNHYNRMEVLPPDPPPLVAGP